MLATLAAAAALAVSLAPEWSPNITTETREQYRERIEMVGEEAWGAAGDYYESRPWVRLHLTRGVLVKVRNESHFRLDVHTGEKLGDRGRSRCLSQIQEAAVGRDHDRWLALSGTDRAATGRCLRVATRLLRGALGMCARALGKRASSLAVHSGAMALYGTGNPNTCREPPAKFVLRAQAWLGTL